MAVTLAIEEAAPSVYPDIPGLDPAIDKAIVWARIENYIRWRWGERAVVFIVEGPGEWTPPLQPYSNLIMEIWFDDAWTSAVIPPSPLGGYRLDEAGPFRFTGVAGSASAPPAAVLEAARRLGLFLAGNDGSEAALMKTQIEGVGSFEFASPNAAARALQYSGAGDLLRPYRILGAS